MLVHDPRRDRVGEVRIDENHVAETETGSFQNGLHAVEREIYLRGRIIRNFPVAGSLPGMAETNSRS